MKRILAALLAAAMMLSLSVVGFAESTTETVSDLTGLTDAVKNSNITITLGKDITVSEPLVVSGTNVTIIGNGNTIKVENPNTFTQKSKNGSVITITGNGARLVGVTVDGGGNVTTTASGLGRKYGIQVYGSSASATLKNVTVKNCGGWGAMLSNRGTLNTEGTLTLSGNGYGIEVSDGGSLNLGDTSLNIGSQPEPIIWVDERTPTKMENIDVGSTGLELTTDESGNIVGTPSAAFVSSSDDNIAVTDNDANTSEAKDAIRAGETVEVELRNSAPAIALDTMNLLGANEDASLVASIGDMTVAIPGGFGRVTEAGRIYYPLGFRSPSRQESDMEDFVPAGAEFETVEAGGSMTMPAAVTVTLETDLEGTVHVYLYDEDADRGTYIASPVEEDGKVTFTTTRLGHFLLTSEKI